LNRKCSSKLWKKLSCPFLRGWKERDASIVVEKVHETKKTALFVADGVEYLRTTFVAEMNVAGYYEHSNISEIEHLRKKKVLPGRDSLERGINSKLSPLE
jgi:hypothetical protein